MYNSSIYIQLKHCRCSVTLAAKLLKSHSLGSCFWKVSPRDNLCQLTNSFSASDFHKVANLVLQFLPTFHGVTHFVHFLLSFNLSLSVKLPPLYPPSSLFLSHSLSLSSSLQSTQSCSLFISLRLEQNSHRNLEPHLISTFPVFPASQSNPEHTDTRTQTHLSKSHLRYYTLSLLLSPSTSIILNKLCKNMVCLRN